MTQNALYRHVESKDELLGLMADAAAGEPAPDDPAADWRTAAATWAHGLIDRYVRHPWMLDLRLRVPVTRNISLWTEQFLRLTKATGMPVGQRVESALLSDG